MTLECLPPSEPARVVRTGVAAPAGVPSELAAIEGGRWRSLVLTIRAPLAWSTAAHVLTIRAVNGPTRAAVLVTQLDQLDWHALGSSVEVVVSVHDRPCSSFVVELTPTVALEGGTVIAEASADEGAAFGDVAERSDKVTAPRAAPLVRVVAMGVDPDGTLRPIAVDASGAMTTGGGGADGADAAIFGDGLDGDATISGPATLSGPAYYDTLTLVAGGVLNPGGWPVFARRLVLDGGRIDRSGQDGASATNNSGVASAGAGHSAAQLGASTGGGGGTGGAANSTTTVPGTVTTLSIGGGGVGGAGGAGGNGPGTGGSGSSGAGGTITTVFVPGSFAAPSPGFLNRNTSLVGGGTGGRGGSGGNGDGTTTGGGGGQGGGGGAVVAVFAQTLETTANAIAGSIRANGGHGGDGASFGYSGGGAGGGGGGGLVVVVYRTREGDPVADLVTADGGDGGNGGIGSTEAGEAGTGGASGSVRVYCIADGTVTSAARGTAAAAPVHPTGSTGAQSRVSI